MKKGIEYDFINRCNSGASSTEVGDMKDVGI